MTLRFKQTLTDTTNAKSAVKAYELVDFEGLSITAEDHPVKGFALSPAKIGDDFETVIIGVCEAKASGAITAGDKLCTATEGKIKKAAATAKNVFGRALTSGGDGEYIRYLKTL